MNTNLQQQLSALMDNELSPGEIEQLIPTLENDVALRKMWGNYHLIGDALRSNLPDRIDQVIAGKLVLALAAEPTVLAPRSAALKTRLRMFIPAVRQIAGLAIAASVTAIAVLGVTGSQNPFNGQDQIAANSATNDAIVHVATENTPAPTEYAQVTDAQWDVRDPVFQAKLNHYLNNHNQYSAPADMQGMLPYARMVGYEQAQ